MKEFSKSDAREIGKGLSINWDKVSLDEFTKGINVELEHGSRHKETNITFILHGKN